MVCDVKDLNCSVLAENAVFEPDFQELALLQVQEERAEAELKAIRFRRELLRLRLSTAKNAELPDLVAPTDRAQDFNAGVDDAREFRMMRSGMSPAYQEGYAFFAAVDGLV